MLNFRLIKSLTAALLTAALLTGCSDDNIPAADTPAADHAIDPGYDLQLYIQKNGNAASRTMRPMYSSEADHNINEVWIRLFIKDEDNWIPADDHAHIWAMVADAEEGADVKEYTTAEGNTFHYIDITESRDSRLRWHDSNTDITFDDGFRLKLAGLLPDSRYLITAIGYNTPMNYEFIKDGDVSINAQWYQNKLEDGVNGGVKRDDNGDVIFEKEIDEVTGLVINNVIACKEEELFFGKTEVTTDAEGNTATYKCTNHTSPTPILDSAGKLVDVARVEMYRQVAGVFGYFKNIPTRIETFDEFTGTTEEIEVAAVRVVCASRSSCLRMTDKLDDRQNFVDEPSFQYGYPETVFTIPIPDDAVKGYTDILGNFVYYKIWHIPAREEGVNDYKYSTVRNSVIGSGFWIPVPAQSFVNTNGNSFDAVTFQIQLLGKPERILRTFNVKLSDGNKSFPVYRDYFYSLGLKVGRGLGSDRSEDDIYYHPDTDEDNPLDLSKEDDIVLTVADAWDESHFFVIGDQQSP